MNLEDRTKKFRDLAYRHGFQFVGISKADFLEDQAHRLEQWLLQGKQGKMSYMERNFDKRLDPRKLVDGAKTVISVLYNYYLPESPGMAEGVKISRYAAGTDYHTVIKDKLYGLIKDWQAQVGEIQGRVFVDSAPVLEKAWAQRSGLGWIGKNSNLITRHSGSWFFLAEIICDIELLPDGPIADYCGKCTRCIDACPTQAITPYSVDGSKCISYYTIELKEAIPEEAKGKMADWIFGCDICQEVCPWTRFAKPHQEPKFHPDINWHSWSLNDWENLQEETFEKVFKDSPIQRTGYQGLRRNLKFTLESKKYNG